MRLKSALLLLLAAALGAGSPRPKLVVVISVDQFAADLLERWGGDLQGGLARLRREGVSFTQAYHAHGLTETGPGHAVLLSGRHPAHTGIVENSWLDRTTGRRTYCVEDRDAWIFGKPYPPGASAAQFHGTTLGGWLRAQVPGSRVFAVTGKDRSAILMAGPQADGVFWFEPDLGFTSSTAYLPQLPTWMAAYDQALLKRLNQGPITWTALRDAKAGAAKVRWALPNQTLEEGLPREIRKAGEAWTPQAWETWKNTPFLDEEVFRAAEHLLDSRKLGRGRATDLLIVGLSATDRIGHAFGNGGAEMLDQLKRLDRRLGVFLKDLRRRHPGVWVVVTGDHGGMDFPERLTARIPEARRIDPVAWMARLRTELRETLKLSGDPLMRGSAPHRLYTQDEVLGTVGATRADMLKAVAAVVRRQPEVLEVVTSAELEAMPLPTGKDPRVLSIRERLRLSYDPDRTGDLLVAFHPHVLTEGGPGDAVAAHLGPHDYDRHVPLFFWGPWKAQTRQEPVATVDLAPTLARELGLVPPEPLDGRPLDLSPKVP